MENLVTITIYDPITKSEIEVEVSRKVAVVYKREHWKEHNSDRSFSRHNTVISELKGGYGDNYETFGEFIRLSPDPIKEEEEIEHEKRKEERMSLLPQAINSLCPSHKEVIDALIFQGMTEMQYASQKGVSQAAVNHCKKRAIKNLQKFFQSRGL